MRRLDAASGREVWLIAATSVDDWPESPPWPGEHFGLFVATDLVVDASRLATRALARGLALVAAWDPAGERIEDDFDWAIVDRSDDPGAPDKVILTTSHARETLEEALEYFLDVSAHDDGFTVTAWVIFAIGDTATRITALLDARPLRHQQ